MEPRHLACLVRFLEQRARVTVRSALDPSAVDLEAVADRLVRELANAIDLRGNEGALRAHLGRYLRGLSWSSRERRLAGWVRADQIT